MNIKITESQLNFLKEDLTLFNPENMDEDYLNKLCKNSNSTESSFCRLLNERKQYDDNLKSELNKYIKILYNFFHIKNAGIFPLIIEIALERKSDTVNFLKTISEFIIDKNFDDTVTKKQLKDLVNKPNEIDFDKLYDLLRDIRHKEFTKYENSFDGENFKIKRSSLKLNNDCLDFLEGLKNVSKGILSKNEFINNVKDCISKSLSLPPVKSDVETITPLIYRDSKGKINEFPVGTKFEIKKMDSNIDSYLSEFFSIFKRSELKDIKGELLGLYNEIIQEIFLWLISNPEANRYLESIKQNIGGIIYENNQIVPIKYIKFYWSNVGQRGCKELRLSIRFRIDDKYLGKKIETYIYLKNVHKLNSIETIITKNYIEPVICPSL